MASRRPLGALILVTVGGSGVWWIRRRALSWGATDTETTADLPGDEFVAEPHLCATRAIAIDAPATSVWPWIAQLGQARGGFYSYDLVENLIGCDIHSADHIVDEWQGVAPGDAFKLHPAAALEVVVVDPPNALVVRGSALDSATAPPFDFTWAFTTHAQSDGTSRLVVRERYRYAHPWVALIVEPVALMSFVMSHKMLRGIRARAQAGASAGN